MLLSIAQHAIRHFRPKPTEHIFGTNAAVRRRKKGGLTHAGGTFTIPAEGTAAIFPN